MSNQNKSSDNQIVFSSNRAIEASGGMRMPLLIPLVACAAFLPTLLNGFVDWGDQSWINNPDFQGLRGRHVIRMLSNFHSGSYQPLSWMTLALDYDLWWKDSFGYHLTSLFVHACSSLLFYFVALELYVSPYSAMPFPASSSRAAAAIAALIFAIHPLRVEPVAWPSARGDIVAGLFILASVQFYLRATERRTNDSPQKAWIAASYVSYALSLLSSTIGLLLPLVLLCLDLYRLRRSEDNRQSLFEVRTLRSQCLRKAPYFLIAGVAAAIGTVVEYRGDVDSGAFEHSPFTSVFHVLARPTFYLWKTVVPFGLSPYYELQSWSLVFAILSAVAMSVGMSVIRRGWPALVICWICYLVLLIPVPGGNPGGQQLLTDRHTYLSCLPWALLFGAAVLYSWHTWMRSGAMPWAVSVGSGFLAFVLIGLWGLTCAQTRVWHDSETLWRHSAAVSHSSQAHLNLAALLEKQGKSNDALTSYKKALELDAQRWDAYEKAALLLQKQGKIREAVEQFQRVVQINPAATDSRDNLASGLVTLGEVGDAVQHFRKVLELAPNRNETRIKLATILAVEGELAEAEQLFEQVVKAQPTDPKVLLKLGQVSAAQGNLHRALAYFQQALRIQPQDAEIHENLGRALQELGRGDEAVKHLQEALRILKSSPASR